MHQNKALCCNGLNRQFYRMNTVVWCEKLLTTKQIQRICRWQIKGQSKVETELPVENTVWKEKLLITIILTFPTMFWKRYLSQVCSNFEIVAFSRHWNVQLVQNDNNRSIWWLVQFILKASKKQFYQHFLLFLPCLQTPS